MESDSQLQIRLLTKQTQFAVPDIPYAVPSTVICSDLNQLVNQILKESHAEHKNVEFDFVVGNELLRIPLCEHLQEQDTSIEQVIEVEFVERFPSPEPQDCLEHDDWVSAAQAGGKWIVTGCYDSTLHLWVTDKKKSSAQHQLTIPGHTGAVKDVAWLELGDEVSSFVSVSQDQTAMIWEWNPLSNSVECVHVLQGHERGLECVAIDQAKSFIATGGWDTVLKIWSTTPGGRDGESSAKKMKLDSQKPVNTPLLTLKGHKEAVSGAQWTDEGEICSSSWDHTLKVWDAELGGLKTEIVGNKSFFDLSWSPLNRTLITASADRHVRLYDPRSTEGTLIKSTFTSHTEWVQAVCWSTLHDQLFISAAYDNQVKLWDTRSPKAPLYDMSGHQDKVLCCDWSNPELIISGGADNALRIFKSKKALS